MRQSHILAFDGVSESGEIRLWRLGDHEVFVRPLPPQSSGRSPTDTLAELASFLTEAAVMPEMIAAIVFCRGPGRFTAARTACAFANAFAATLKIWLYPLSAEEYQAFKADLPQVFDRFADRRATHAEALFDAPPRITPQPQKSF